MKAKIEYWSAAQIRNAVLENRMREWPTCRGGGSSSCRCGIGYTYEEMCVSCRDVRSPGDIYSFCVCPPKEEENIENRS